MRYAMMTLLLVVHSSARQPMIVGNCHAATKQHHTALACRAYEDASFARTARWRTVFAARQRRAQRIGRVGNGIRQKQGVGGRWSGEKGQRGGSRR